MRHLLLLGVLALSFNATAQLPLIDTNRIVEIALPAIAENRPDLAITNLALTRIMLMPNPARPQEIFVEFREQVTDWRPETNSTNEPLRLRPRGVVVQMDQSGRVDRVSPVPRRPTQFNRVEEEAKLSHPLSYQDRLYLRRMEEQARLKELAAEPKLTKEDVERLVREHQMEAIRAGGVPLPIPLTQEMDDQLVREGILPPIDGGTPGVIRSNTPSTNTP